MDQLTCQKCGYKWTPKKQGYTPKECPQCKSRNWNKVITALLMLALATLSTACQNCRTLQPPTGMQVYVGTGQSLMAAFFNTLQQDPAHPQVKMFKDGKWQPAVEPTSEQTSAATSPLTSFGKEMVRINPNIQVGVINCAVGSTTLDEWMPGSTGLPVTGLFEACEAKIHQAKAADPTIQIAGILHNEGQSLAHECAMGYWPTLFPQFAKAWQDAYGDIPVIFAQLGNLPEECGAGYLNSIRNQQAAIHAHKVFMITTQDLTTTDGVHFDTTSQIIQGQRFAQVASQVNPLKECSEPWWSRMVRF